MKKGYSQIKKELCVETIVKDMRDLRYILREKMPSRNLKMSMNNDNVIDIDSDDPHEKKFGAATV